MPSPNPNFRALATLAERVRKTVLLDPGAIRAMVLVELCRCNAEIYTTAQIATLVRVLLLVVYGDFLDTPTGLPGPGWPERFAGCQRLIARLRAAGGHADMFHPPVIDMHGNTHLMMRYRNNTEIADLIIEWLGTDE